MLRKARGAHAPRRADAGGRHQIRSSRAQLYRAMVMPKKPLEWQTIDAVSTPSQMRSYIDACKVWLLALPKEDDDTEITPHQKPPAAVTACEHHNNGMLRENIYECNIFKCFTCNTECEVANGRIVVANPFTRSQCLMLCANCHGG